MTQNNISVVLKEELEELFTVACIHCSKRIFRFSENLFNLNRSGIDDAIVTLHCPSCGGITEVQINGTISAG